MFNFFKSKKEKTDFASFDFKSSFEEVYASLSKVFIADFESSKVEFVRLTGPFDEENVYFENKLDDFRHWFVFLYKRTEMDNGLLFEMRETSPVSKHYANFSKVSTSLFEVLKVKGDKVLLRDLFSQDKVTVKDHIKALSLEPGNFIQSALFETSPDVFDFGVSILYHPQEAKKHILKKVKFILSQEKKAKKQKMDARFKLLNELLSCRYQLFKYKQVAVERVYSDEPLIKKKEGVKSV